MDIHVCTCNYNYTGKYHFLNLKKLFLFQNNENSMKDIV